VEEPTALGYVREEWEEGLEVHSLHFFIRFRLKLPLDVFQFPTSANPPSRYRTTIQAHTYVNVPKFEDIIV
jgi:hypothetical protein